MYLLTGIGYGFRRYLSLQRVTCEFKMDFCWRSNLNNFCFLCKDVCRVCNPCFFGLKTGLWTGIFLFGVPGSTIPTRIVSSTLRISASMLPRCNVPQRDACNRDKNVKILTELNFFFVTEAYCFSLLWTEESNFPSKWRPILETSPWNRDYPRSTDKDHWLSCLHFFQR